jgi:hypothetical protein
VLWAVNDAGWMDGTHLYVYTLLLIEVRHFVQKLPVDGTANNVFFLPHPTYQQVNVDIIS